jgi:biopolymer transport protein TolR
MASKMNSESDEIVSEINITPFVDVMLVLLVIFMISAPAVYSNTLKVSVPQTQSQESAPDREHITLQMTLGSNGDIEFEGKKYNAEKLEPLLKEVLKADSQADAIINADGSLTHAQVMKIVDLLRTKGITNISFGVQPAK